MKEILVDTAELKENIDMFFRAAITALCSCYDHTKGLYPDDCSCETREGVNSAIGLLIKEHKNLLKEYGLQD